MTQNFLRKLMLIAVLLTGSHAFAHDFEAQNSDGVTIYYNITSEDDKTVEVTFKGSYYDSFSNEYSSTVVIPEIVTNEDVNYSVISIGRNAFTACTSLTSITIGNSVIRIGDGAFNCCYGLRFATIGNSVTDIDRAAFSSCTSLTSVTIGNSVTSIGNYAFNLCQSLTSITIPNSVINIGDYTFSSCTSLTSVTIGNSVTSIGNYAFYGCILLTNITIGNTVTSIGNGAFGGCRSLTSITIPNCVKSIGMETFWDCSSLTEIICESLTPPTAYSSTFKKVPTTATLYVPVGSKEDYANATGWNYFANIVEMEFENETETTITIMDATNQGSVSFSYEKGKAFDFTVTPVTGYIVNTVLVNGEICEAEDGVYNIESVSEKTTISVSYELDPETGVSTLSINNIKVYGCDNTLTVTGVEFGDKISVYDLNGTQIYTQNSVGYTNSISLNNNGVYIVKVNGKSFKVML